MTEDPFDAWRRALEIDMKDAQRRGDPFTAESNERVLRSHGGMPNGPTPSPPGEQARSPTSAAPAETANRDQTPTSDPRLLVAAEWAVRRARPDSIGKCATYVREAFGLAGITVHVLPTKPGEGRLYGPQYESAGFVAVAQGVVQTRDSTADGYSPEVGDVAIFQGNAAHGAGHVELYTQSGWVSDYKQYHFVPWPKNFAGVSYKIYRLSRSKPSS